MTRHGSPAAKTPRGTSPITTLPAPTTDPFPIADAFKMIDRAPTKTSSSMVIPSSGCGSGSGAYLCGTVSTGWKSVSATTTSAPRRTRSPIAIKVVAQIDAPLILTSEPIRIVAPGRRVRCTTRLETSRAVRDDREMSRLLDPIDILESRSRPTIGHPSEVTASPISPPSIVTVMCRSPIERGLRNHEADEYELGGVCVLGLPGSSVPNPSAKGSNSR